MITNESRPILADNQMKPGMASRNGTAWYPPRNRTLAMAENATMPAYSDRRKKANFSPVYSVYAPKMISESAMGMSKGGRVSSASEAIMKIKNITGWVNTYQ